MLNFHRIPSFLKREYGRTLELALLLAAGHMIAVGLVCARSNPLFSPAGSYGSILILLAAAPLLGWGCCRETVGRLETAADFGKPRNLVFCGVALLFSAFGVTRHWEAVRFSLKPADLTGAAWPVLTVFCCGLLLLSVLLALHLREAARRGELHRYLGALAGVAGLPAAVTLLLYRTHYLHLHHYAWSLMLIPFFRYRQWWSRLPQAALLGIFIDGVASWGVETLWYPR